MRLKQLHGFITGLSSNYMLSLCSTGDGVKCIAQDDQTVGHTIRTSRDGYHFLILR